MSDELNDLTRRLYAQGYTRDHHPDTVCWSDWKNFGYKWETMLGFTWETPCGLLIQGESEVGRSLAISECSYQHIWYCPENDNPLLRCPFQQKGCAYVPQGFPLIMCPCHRTHRPYNYENSVEKIETAHHKEAHDLKKVNIFYDVRRTWITRRGFLEEKKVTLTKGLKVFDHAVAQTDAEIWLKIKEHEASPLNNYAVIEHPKKTMEDRRQEYFSRMHRHYDDRYDYFEFHYEVENIRIARSGQRDLLQDLRDAAEGIEVAHAADTLQAAKAQKRAGREAAKARRLRKAEAMILAQGWDALDDIWKRRTEKLLGGERIAELNRQWTARQPKQEETQLCMF